MEATRRQFDKLRHRGQPETGHASVIVMEFEDVDKLLARLIDDAKSLRESWVHMALSQLNVTTEYTALYQPIVVASTEPSTRMHQPTPPQSLARVTGLRDIYTEIKEDIMNEVAMFDAGVISPATRAREYIGSFRKTIKKHRDKRMDYDKCQDKVTKLQKKSGRSAKEDAALLKAEEELSHFQEEFTIMDNYLQEMLPGVIEVTMRLVIPLVSSLASTQNRLLGISYTALHTFSQDHALPSPAPPMDVVMSEWSTAWQPAQQDVEAISFISSGRGRFAPLNLGDAPAKPSLGHRMSSPLLRLGSSNSRQPSPSGTSSLASSTTHLAASREPSPARPPTASPAAIRPGLAPTDFTAAARLGPNAVSTPASRASSVEYFGHNSASQVHAPVAQRPALGSSASAPSAASLVVGKKKPPPPPPKKKPALRMPDEFVVAQFDFVGQGAGDLSFRAGDRIRIVKKTATDQDWWEGELGGATGSFPANYCKAA